MKKNFLIIVFIFLMTFCLSSCVDEKINNDAIIINLTTTRNDREQLSEVVKLFNKKDPLVQVEFTTFETEDVKNYYLDKKHITTDIITFNNYTIANKYEKELVNFNKMNFLSEFEVSIINFLKSANGNLNVIPGPGSIRANCYNDDLMKKYNIEYPKNHEEFMDMLEKLPPEVIPYVTYGEHAPVQELVEIAFPYFCYTTIGMDFLKKYDNGLTSINSSDNADVWNNIFDDYKEYYTLGFYDKANIDYSFEDAVKQFNKGNTLMISKIENDDLDSYIDPSINYKYYPFTSASRAGLCFTCSPLYYLSIFNDLNRSSEKDIAIKKFFDFYTSEEGIEASRSIGLKYKTNTLLSFYKDNEFLLNGQSDLLQDSFAHGRYYIMDDFNAIFLPEVELLKEFINGSYLTKEFINKLDREVVTKDFVKEVEIKIKGNFDFNIHHPGGRISNLANYIADQAIACFKTDAVVLPYKIIYGNILGDSFKVSDFKRIISTVRYYKANIKVSELKKIISKMLKTSGSLFPIISGIKLEGTKDNFIILDLDNHELEDNRLISIIMEYGMLEKFYNMFSNVERIDLIGCISALAKSQNEIVAPDLDDRYNFTDLK